MSMRKVKETLFISTILEKQLTSYDMEKYQTQVFYNTAIAI